jgi:hypothetical protein
MGDRAMTPAAQYRSLAGQLRERANEDADCPQLAAEWNHLADCYVQLAEQAERENNMGAAYNPILGWALPNR